MKQLRKYLEVSLLILRRLIPDPFDVLLVSGGASIVYGVFQFNRAASWIVAGVLLVICSLLASAGRKGRRPDLQGIEE